MTRIFISYRRKDSAGHTGRLYDHLTKFYSQDSVFLDVVTIQPGDDFLQTIDAALAAFDTAIVVIGPDWATIQKGGRPRLHLPDDVVRGEVAAALRRHQQGTMRVFPVLVDRAPMPAASDLPPDLQPLCRLDAVEVSHDRFEYDVQRLVDAIGGAYGTVVLYEQPSAVKRILSNRVRGSKFAFDPPDVNPIAVLLDGKSVRRLRTQDDHTLQVKVGIHYIALSKAGYLPSDPVRFRIRGGERVVLSYKLPLQPPPGRVDRQIMLQREDVV